MKKKAAAILLAALLLTGCGAAAPSSGTARSTAASSAQPAASDSAADDSTLTSTDGYTISRITLLHSGNRNIQYLRLDGLANTEAQDRWNTYFLDAAAGDKTQTTPQDTVSDSFSVKTADDSRISVMEQSEYYYSGSAHPFLNVVTLNLDPATGALQSLPLWCDTEALAKAILAGEGCTLTAMDGTTPLELSELESLNGFSDEAGLRQVLDGFDFRENAGKDDVTTGWSYWEDGTLHLLFPATHAVGDWALVTMDAGWQPKE